MATILLAEDNQMLREMIQRYLEISGHRVLAVANGADALAAALAEQPDLVLMDLGMPVMDGLTATRLIKASPTTADTPVIALTAHAFADDQALARAAGCTLFLTKPIDFALLLASIRSLTEPPPS
jgi:CheY-like chemotaxis protein